MRLVTLFFVLFCAGMHANFAMHDKPELAAIYNVATLIIASILACTSDRR